MQNGVFKLSFNPYLTARLNNLLRTYPRPSLDKTAPSEIANVKALM